MIETKEGSVECDGFLSVKEFLNEVKVVRSKKTKKEKK